MIRKEGQLDWKDVWIAKNQEETYKILFHIVFFTKEYDVYTKYLNNAELEYFKELHSERRKLSYLFGRYSLKSNVADYIGEVKLQKIHIRNGIFSQPIIQIDGQSNLQGTLSHCENCAVSLAYDASLVMGIDIEDRDRDFEKFIYNELTEGERRLISRNKRVNTLLFGVMWTIKEALSKCLRTGFTIPMSIMEIEEIKHYGYYYESTFKHFTQYKAITLVLDELICTITYPKNVELTFDAENIIYHINQFNRERNRYKK